MRLRVLYQDPDLIAVDKPAGIHVHPPEDPAVRISPRSNALAIVSRQVDRYLYPVHRIDCSTSGVLLYALNSETARAMSGLFGSGGIQKTYYAVVRGWLGGPQVIDRPLKSEADPTVTVPAETRVEPLARIEFSRAVGRYASARYTLVRAEPRTGRFHQIRRHLAGFAHPIVGDTVHGDGAHNRMFRELGIEGLLLKAQAVEFSHPATGLPLRIESRWSGRWHQVFDRFGVCPI